MEDFADDEIRFNENGISFSNRYNSLGGGGKGEIAYYEQFLLFPHCFQKTCIADT